jgi:dTDP-4-dehydrorhamnose reductase
MKVAIIGANGQLGSDLSEVFSQKHEVIRLAHNDIDIVNAQQVFSVLGSVRPDVVLNTAAAHNVPKCEEDPMNAYLVNGVGSLNLAKASNEFKFMLVHYSTDYVFDGAKAKPYFEDDKTNPLNVYATTKLAGEGFICNYSERGYVIRVSGIYGKVPCRAKGGNFITTMVRLAKEKPEVRVVNDEILTPTSTFDIAVNSRILVEREPKPGVYHMTNEGECSWYEFAHEIFALLRLKTPLLETTTSRMTSQVKRPLYSVLENGLLKKEGMNHMPHWRDSLATFLRVNYS